MAPPSTLVFEVTRREPEFVKPARPTPHEFKPLSDIDDQEGIRFQAVGINLYRYHRSMKGKDVAKVIRDALAETLVFYYPFAGRIRETEGRKLVVECTGEGVLFIEADADVSIDQFGEEDAILPPFPCLDEILFDVPGSSGITDSPLLLFQVTRTKCGGFIFAHRINHTMADAIGLVQFLKTIGEIARGAASPSVPPVWDRELLCARNPPRVTLTHHEYEPVAYTKGRTMSMHDLTYRTFFFGSAEVSKLRSLLPPHLSGCSTFDIVTAFLWKCRTAALQYDPSEEVRVTYLVNARSKYNPPLPNGYYGNAIAFVAALTTSKKLCEGPLEHAVELVWKAKKAVNEEYMKSLADLMVIRGRPAFTRVQTYVVSDLMRIGFAEVDFGWGKAAFGGPAYGGGPGEGTFYMTVKNEKGENGMAAPMSLSEPVMERFAKEVESVLADLSDTTVDA